MAFLLKNVSNQDGTYYLNNQEYILKKKEFVKLESRPERQTVELKLVELKG